MVQSKVPLLKEMEKPFKFQSLREISDKFEEVVKDEIKKYNAVNNMEKLPPLRRDQINLTRSTLTAISKSDLSDEEKNMLGTAAVRLNKYIIKNEKAGFVGYFSSPDNSLFYIGCDKIIFSDANNPLLPNVERQCLGMLRDFLVKQNILKAFKESALPPKVVLGTLSQLLNGFSSQELETQKNSLNHIELKSSTNVLLKDLAKQAKLEKLRQKPEKLALNHKEVLLDEIRSFKPETLKQVETVIKNPRLRMKIFNNPLAFTSPQIAAKINKAKQEQWMEEKQGFTTVQRKSTRSRRK